MRTGLVHALAWSLATGAAVTLSWWGVHTVMTGTAYDPPRALPISTEGTNTQQAEPVSSSTQRARRTPPAQAPSRTATPARSHPATAEPPAEPMKSPATTSPPASPPPGNVKSYPTDGGRAVFDIGAASAQLVSATPDSGWEMQVWTQPTWIRVTFTKNGREASVFCTWYEHAPLVEFDNR